MFIWYNNIITLLYLYLFHFSANNEIGPKNSNRVGSRKDTKKLENTWTEKDIQNIIRKLNSLPGKSIRKVAKQFVLRKFTISKSVICNYSFSPAKVEITGIY